MRIVSPELTRDQSAKSLEWQARQRLTDLWCQNGRASHGIQLEEEISESLRGGNKNLEALPDSAEPNAASLDSLHGTVVPITQAKAGK